VGLSAFLTTMHECGGMDLNNLYSATMTGSKAPTCPTTNDSGALQGPYSRHRPFWVEEARTQRR
jgi:hypothetical protein